MPDQFPSLVKAILDDDRARVKDLLKHDAALVKAGAAKARLELGIPHWIYAGDTALHVAAAGYWVEIAKRLRDAGAEVGAAMNHRIRVHRCSSGLSFFRLSTGGVSVRTVARSQFVSRTLSCAAAFVRRSIETELNPNRWNHE